MVTWDGEAEHFEQVITVAGEVNIRGTNQEVIVIKDATLEAIHIIDEITFGGKLLETIYQSSFWLKPNVPFNTMLEAHQTYKLWVEGMPTPIVAKFTGNFEIYYSDAVIYHLEFERKERKSARVE